MRRRLGGQRAAAAAQVHREQEQRAQLGGKRLGRRDADLEPGVGIERVVGGARNRRVDDVGNGEDLGPFAPRLFDRGQGVGGLAGLRHRHRPVAGLHDGIAIAKLRRQIDLDRDPRELLDHVLADERRVIRGAAGKQEQPPDAARVELHPVEPARRPAGDCTRPRRVSVTARACS